MEARTKQEIIELLEKSIEGIQIKFFDKQNIDIVQCREMLRLQNRDIETVLRKMALDFIITDNSAKERLLEIIKLELSAYINNDKALSCALFLIEDRNPFKLDKVIQSLCRISIAWNTQKAIDVLERTIEENKIHFEIRVVLNGLKTNRELQILDGVKIISLSRPPNDLKKDLFIGYRAGAKIDDSDYSSKALLIINCNASPAFSKPPEYMNYDVPFCVNTSSVEINQFDYGDFCRMLSLVLNHAVTPFAVWNFLKEEELLLHESSVGRGGPFTLEMDRQFPVCDSMSDTQITESTELYEKFTNLAPQDRQSLTIGISRWLQAKTGHNQINQMIDLGIAFESLYIKPGERNMSFNMSIRAAWYLGENIEERKELMTELKKIYGLRSDAVHTGKFKDTVKEINMRDFINRAQDLCQMSIVKVIREGKFPDWDSLIMGSGLEPTQIY